MKTTGTVAPYDDGIDMNYDICGEHFPSKASLRKRITDILYAYGDGGCLSVEHLKFMIAVLEMHPDALQKIGVGVADMVVRTNPVFRHTRGFWIERVDGTSTDFSYLSCLNGATSQLGKFTNACRRAVYPFIREKKKAFFAGKTTVPCPYTGILISLESCHADHKYPMTFQNIMYSFIQERNINVETIKIRGDRIDGEISDRFEDAQLEKDWIDYHNSRAVIQIVSREANLGILRRNQH